MKKETKDLINKRKIAYVYLMHRMFEGNPTMLLKVMRATGVTVEDLQDWDMDYKEAVYQTIQEEDSRGVKLKDTEDVPSIKGIKEKVLRRVDALILATKDPARLAQVYKILSEFEVTDDKKEKSVLDAINESIKPLTPRQKEKTMLEKMREENKISATGKKRGRPKKVQAPDPNMQFAGLLGDEPAEENEEETEETEE